MENEKLIELVRTHPVLYDHSHPKYSDNHYKERTWKEIGRELNHSSISCKARWNNIRDNYRKYKKKMLRDNGMGMLRSYKYGEQLQFLDEYFHDRKSVMKCRDSGGGGGGGGDDDDVESVEVTYCSDSIDNVPIFDPKAEYQQMDECCDDDGSISSPPPPPPPPPHSLQAIAMVGPACGGGGGGKMRHSTSMVSSMGYVEEVSDPLHHRAVDAFLAGIAPTLKSLDPYNLNLAKGEIFAIVQRYEMKIILESSKTGSAVGGCGGDRGDGLGAGVGFMTRPTPVDSSVSIDGAIGCDPLK